MENKDVQKIAKMTIQYAKEIIKPGMNLIDLRNDREENAWVGYRFFFDTGM